ncbi:MULTISPECIES: circularly permuted type 2 ATP-grasp protein [unclassified Microbacterium]|uniref:circularly permuted type 2 ATP-grasp protein n=1 Tax=unclassified Microbacterium TaxID=2609290 RepID=UPI00214C6BB8|nr:MULTISPECIES: circularly permuted type 2 ATP-grasp protein [unclassified Microbacterium]MCR2810883.1 circularly permuted type 2 ATP-grasp protein [Microbacterium sp. zg.B185]WIM19714.1 circularly permuted type 2 ATP-grasp protein [Microbacterium sp. zg-B185]
MSVLRDYAAGLAQPTLPFTPATGARFDEVVGADGALRPAWRGMAAIAVDLTPAQVDRIDTEITTLLADDGVTYGSGDAGSQPWQLDPMPLVLDAVTWGRLEIGLAQRTELLNALLADIYGEQRLLAEGVIPAAVVFGHSGFVRPIVRPRGFDPHPLILASTDLGRDAAGEWHVLTDRVQAPSGLGYAMENRRVLSRVLPELYDAAGLHRMEPYFSALRAALLQAAPAGLADPRIVVLSPGTHSETAYDQAFLANILGFPLVQGEDLVVQEGSVWIKPAGFPQQQPQERVDVILRRVDAEWCDPLELRAGSQLGVAGLTEAVRRGNVRLVNGLGAGVLENPGLMPFMPAVCERLLGEQLRLPSVPTLWCGEPDGLSAVLAAVADDRGEMTVREIDGRAAELSALDPASLRARILAAPHRFVGQTRVPLSQAPAWGSSGRVSGRVQPHPLVLRAFTVRDGAIYRPLVGGLATLVDGPTAGLATKDVWVLKASPGEPDQGMVEPAPVPLSRAVPVLSPRAVEDMFWSGRYAERAEDLVRLVITVSAYAEQLDFTSTTQGGAALRALFRALQRLGGTRWSDPDLEQRSLLVDADRPGSAAHSLERLRDALEAVRDQLSGDTWRAFGSTDRAMRALRTAPRPQIAESASRMLGGILSLQGVTANMMRDDGWHAIETGRHLERGLQVCTLLTATTIASADAGTERAVLGGVLMASESSVTHRRRFRGGVRAADVLELLLADPGNPRSLTFALGHVRDHVSQLAGSTGSTRPERLLEQLEQTLEQSDIRALAAPEDGRRAALEAFLGETRAQLERIGDAIVHVHFGGGPHPRPLSALSLTEVPAAPATEVSR